jgi:23S rRNA pseudouridine1911/1915/1917 synthase
MHVHPEGQEAVTEFEVLGRRRAPDGAPVSLVSCRPRTGRQHQIRAHLHHTGLHLLGDKIYGADEMIFDRFARGALTDEDRVALRLPRQALHAWRLSLPHPRTSDRLDLEAPLAPDLRDFWGACLEAAP